MSRGRIVQVAVRASLLAAVVLAVLWATPTGWVMRAPGSAENVSSMIRIEGQTVHPSLGKLYLTTVLVEPATALFCLYAMMDPGAELVDASAEEVRILDPSPGGPLETQMEQSQYLAKVAALRRLGYRIESEDLGADILNVLPDSPAVGRLRAGDLVTRAEGRPVRTAQDLRAVLASLPGGAPVNLTVERGGKAVDVPVRSGERDGHAHLGVAVRTRVSEAPLPFRIDIQAEGIEGASAGLMFALGIYNDLTPQDITMGMLVAGTGTIDADGQVGEIMGVDMKVRAAERVDAEVFLCPKENAAEAAAAATTVEVVPVETLDQALQALKARGNR